MRQQREVVLRFDDLGCALECGIHITHCRTATTATGWWLRSPRAARVLAWVRNPTLLSAATGPLSQTIFKHLRALLANHQESLTIATPDVRVVALTPIAGRHRAGRLLPEAERRQQKRA